ncbi:MAG: MGMT family protein [Deltaproteobacteria bacterium]|nr:MGMT family protein [Deltaproteobacteria bacterium]
MPPPTPKNFPPHGDSRYERVYELVGLIPAGQVATYGQIAGYIDRCTPRMVGFAMAATPEGRDIPWHRVINSRGMISIRANGERDMMQRLLLEAEGVHFDEQGRVDLDKAGWEGL